MRSLINAIARIQFYSCFITTATQTSRLPAAVTTPCKAWHRCWLDEHPVLPGDDLCEHVDRGIPFRDKFLLCCSEHSLKPSSWVEKEIVTALEKEDELTRQRNRRARALKGRKDNTHMFNLNRITLIGNTGADAKVIPNGPTTIPLATNATWTDSATGERRTRTEWHSLVMWNVDLGHWAASLPKGTPLFVEGELIYEQYSRKTDATVKNKSVQVEVPTRIAKIRVHRLIRLDPPQPLSTSMSRNQRGRRKPSSRRLGKI